MSNTIQIKRGSSVPTASQLAEYELGFNTTNNTLYINKNGTIIIPIANINSLNTQNLIRPTGLRGLNDNTLQALVNTTRANRLAFLPADQIIIEKTTDGGVTWVDAGFNDAQKVGLFSETRPSLVLPLLNGVKSLQCGLRITITAMKYNVPSGTAETEKYNYWSSSYVTSAERYCQLKEMYFWLSSNSDTIGITVQRASGANPNNWSTIFNDSTFYMTGWSGCNYIRFNQSTFGGSTSQTGQSWNYRIILMTKGVNGTDTLATTYTTSAQAIMEIRGYGDTWWNGSNEYMKNDKLYTHDYNKNATFPAKVTAISFAGSGASLTDINASNISSGTLGIAQGGTGATSFTANSLIMSGSSTTAALTTRAITNNTSNTAIVNNTNIPTMNTIYYGLVTVNNASQTRATAIYAPTSAGTANQILVSSGGTAAPTWKATASGAAYVTSTNGALTFGTLPVAQGGTGLTSLDTFVRTTEAQTISGIKTFTSYPRVRNTVAATTGAQFPAIFFQGALSTDDLARIGVVTDTNDAPVYIGFRIMSYNSSTYLPLEKYENYYLPQVTADLEDSVSYQVHTTKTLKIQHGFATISTTAPSSNNITYSGFTTVPKVFATYNINATSISGDNTGDKGAIKIYNISTSGCKVVIGGSASGTMRIAWLAIGT